MSNNHNSDDDFGSDFDIAEEDLLEEDSGNLGGPALSSANHTPALLPSENPPGSSTEMRVVSS